MEGMKGGGGGRVVGVGEDHDMGEYGMHQCIDHPHHRNNNPSGGICAFCLQEKLGKLVSSAFPLPIQPFTCSSSPPSSSSSPPSFRSNTTTAPSASITVPRATSATSASSSLSLSVPPKKNNGSDHHYHEYYTRSRLPFLLAKKKKKKPSTNSSSSSSSAPATSDIIFKRSKSTATPRRDNKFLEDADDDIVIEDFSPRKRNGFWSFLYLSSKPSPSSSSIKKLDAKSFRDSNGTPRISASASSGLMSTVKPREKCMVGSTTSLGRKSDTTVVEESDNASGSSFERKVSRSRSVGCGSRSFSGDFFERISTGLGDCTLRRVESQREGNKPHKVAASAGGAIVNRGGDHHHHHCMKERVRCGGIFGGFMMMSNSSSYWVSSSGGDDGMNGRIRSWGWAFASPMRAFSSNKASSKDNKTDKNATPNLQAIPSLLTVRG